MILLTAASIDSSKSLSYTCMYMHINAQNHTHTLPLRVFFSQHTCKYNAVLASAEFSVTRTWLQCKALRRYLVNPIKSYLQNTFSFLGYSLYILLKNFNILLTAAPLDALNNTDDIRLGWLYVVGRQFSLLEIRDFSEEEKQTSKQQKKFTAFSFFFKSLRHYSHLYSQFHTASPCCSFQRREHFPHQTGLQHLFLQ